MAFATSSAVTMRFSDVRAIASSRTASSATPRSAARFASTASIRAPATEPGQIDRLAMLALELAFSSGIARCAHRN